MDLEVTTYLGQILVEEEEEIVEDNFDEDDFSLEKVELDSELELEELKLDELELELEVELEVELELEEVELVELDLELELVSSFSTDFPSCNALKSASAWFCLPFTFPFSASIDCQDPDWFEYTYLSPVEQSVTINDLICMEYVGP